MNDRRVELPEDNVFRYLSPEPTLSEMGISAEKMKNVVFKTASELMAERRKWRENSECCPQCGGKGRIAR